MASQHFSSMERVMAADLNSWLCNIYFEVRYLPKEESVLRGGRSHENELSTTHSGKIAMNFITKVLHLPSGRFAASDNNSGHDGKLTYGEPDHYDKDDKAPLVSGKNTADEYPSGKKRPHSKGSILLLSRKVRRNRDLICRDILSLRLR